jgi:hypothetical protein
VALSTTWVAGGFCEGTSSFPFGSNVVVT